MQILFHVIKFFSITIWENADIYFGRSWILWKKLMFEYDKPNYTGNSYERDFWHVLNTGSIFSK